MITWNVARKFMNDDSLKIIKLHAKDKNYKLGNKNIIRILYDLFDEGYGYRIINKVIAEIREIKTKPIF